MVKVFDRMRQEFCGLRGHDTMVSVERDRMFLKCFSCGYESQGWTVSHAVATASTRPDDSRATLRRPRLINAH